MSRLVKPRVERRFADLMAMGRAQLPALAPHWTDHNAHDPGITLMELLAWVAEAQLYAVGHTRRDERAAYAALLSIVPGGTQAARGLLWPDTQDPRSPAATFAQSVAIPADAIVHVVNADAPAFHPDGKVLWIPGDVRRIATRLADGRLLDHTAVNQREGPAFQPFGELARPRDVLAIDFECRGDGGMFPPKREDATGAYWTLGVRAAAPLVAGAQDDAARIVRLAATLVADGDRYPVAIVSDTTDGMLRTGALVLDVSAVAPSPKRFTLELRAPRGFARPPRVLRIAPNVLPIVQGREIAREVHTVNATTDWSFRLDVPGLRFASAGSPVRIDVVEPSGQATWQRCDSLATQGPADKVYELDLASDRIIFGNGINGRAPPEQAQVLAWYSVSDGAQGSVARNRKWNVQGFGEPFGVNPDAVAGGAGADDWRAQRRESRRRAREDHALVSANDIIGAALKLPLLDVARAWIVPPNTSGPRSGIVTLVAMRGLRAGEGAARVPESQRWLDAIHRRLLARMPLGTRLSVIGPRYSAFAVKATLEADAGRNVDDIQRNGMDTLHKRLATTGPSARLPGVPVSCSDIAGWLRSVDGVARVVSLQLVRDSGENVASVAVSREGLPRLDEADSTVEVRRAGQGGAP
jgi:predicted phage baseplate assembly protein